MMRALGDEETAAFCDAQWEKLRRVRLPHGNSKQAAALLALSLAGMNRPGRRARRKAEKKTGKKARA